MYSYFDEFCGALMWAGLLVLPLVLLLAGYNKLLRHYWLSIVVYLSLLSWAQAAFTETYTARQVVGYAPSSRYSDLSGQGFFGGNGNYDKWGDVPCQEPVYAHKNRGDKILWLGPLGAAMLACLYDASHRTKYGQWILLLYLPFLLLAYSFTSPNTLPKPCKEAAGTVR